MVNVELIGFTQDALELLILTKGTRLGSQQTVEEIQGWPEEKKMEHLAYMRDTIQSSWEFVDYTFRISGVTRAFTHQFVRTRSNSYAQEAQRVVDLSNAEWVTPSTLAPCQARFFNGSMEAAIEDYARLRREGVAAQDARGLIPTNVCTSIIAKINLRTMAHMAELRLCTRTQGEYQDVFRAMRAEVLKVHPWAKPFINVWCVQHGTCAFPRYTECPIQRHTYHGDAPYHQQRLRAIEIEFNSIRHESVPVVFEDSTTSDGRGGDHG